LSDRSLGSGVRRRTLLAGAGATVAALAGCSLDGGGNGNGGLPAPDGSVAASSPAFDGEVPVRYACTDAGGENASPVIELGDRPEGTGSLAVVMDDLDAGTEPFVHWLLYGVAGDRLVVPQALPTDGEVLDGAKQGRNDRGGTGYFGPCPPADDPHTYRLTVYAVESHPGVDRSADRGTLKDGLRGSVLGASRLAAMFDR
jgi:Raf kinase inhibitor-like YbhB/YbcL family protein